MPRLHIYDPRERALVSAADKVLSVAAAAIRPMRRRRPPIDPRRILLLRLERIGDLLMALPAIASVRALAPGADIDLAVGRWNLDLATAIPSVTRVLVLDAAWLTREGGGLGLPALMGTARQWRRARYDLAINFEPDLRSNLLLAASGAAWTAGYASGGGGALLDLALEYDTRAHTTDNARRLVREVFGRAPAAADPPLLSIPGDRVAHIRMPEGSRPRVGLHVSGGREIKQWPPARFAEVAGRLVESLNATIVLTGSGMDRPLVDSVKGLLPESHVVDAARDGSLVELAGLLQGLDLLITGDTGPMHLAASVGTPIVAVFGPSDPARYAPRGPHDRVVRVDLPCAPCNRIRLPPERCTGHTPDCLAFVTTDAVFAAALSVLEEATTARRAGKAEGPGVSASITSP